MNRRIASGIALVAALLVGTPARATPPASTFDRELDRIEQLSRERPERAAEALEALLAVRDRPQPQTLALLQAMAGVQIRLGEAGAVALAIDEVARRTASTDVRAQLRLAVLRAWADQRRGLGERAAADLQRVLPVLRSGCASAPAATGSACDVPAAWEAHRLLRSRLTSLQSPTGAIELELAAHAIAVAAQDAVRQSLSAITLVELHVQDGRLEDARRWFGRAQEIVRTASDARLDARLTLSEASLAAAEGRSQVAIELAERAVLQAREAEASRTEQRALARLSQAYLAFDRPAEALRTARTAFDRHASLDPELAAALHRDAGLAHIALRQPAAAWRDIADALRLWNGLGQTQRVAAGLRDAGIAFAAAGDPATALQLYRREREISALLSQAQGESALRELRARNDAESKQRAIDLLERDNARKADALADGETRQRLYLAIGLLLSVSLAAAAFLYRRVRAIRRLLHERHDTLRERSERDPLTGLANRRFFDATLATRPDARFRGALLLVDIDHFKRINDTHGHAVGDEVIVAVARRIEAAVRAGDLAVRWGGEEFLVYAADASHAQAEAIAGRVLHALRDAAVPTSAGPLPVSVSIGYAAFPLDGQRTLPRDAALTLVDMALYRAKREGRRRALGVASIEGGAPVAQPTGADFDAAVQDGRLALTWTLAA